MERVQQVLRMRCDDGYLPWRSANDRSGMSLLLAEYKSNCTTTLVNTGEKQGSMRTVFSRHTVFLCAMSVRPATVVGLSCIIFWRRRKKKKYLSVPAMLPAAQYLFAQGQRRRLTRCDFWGGEAAFDHVGKAVGTCIGTLFA